MERYYLSAKASIPTPLKSNKPIVNVGRPKGRGRPRSLRLPTHESDIGSSGSGELAYLQSRASSRGSVGSVGRNGDRLDFQPASPALRRFMNCSRVGVGRIAPIGHTALRTADFF